TLSGSTPVRVSGGTTRVPLCALRTESPVVVAPPGYVFARPSAGSRDQAGSCAPVRITGADARAPVKTGAVTFTRPSGFGFLSLGSCGLACAVTGRASRTARATIDVRRTGTP